jgi:hypothetical protein
MPFITYIREPLEKYVDMYYSVEKFRAAYETLIPDMPNKSQYNGQNQTMVSSCIHHSLKRLLVQDITRGSKDLQRRGAAQQETKIHINAPFARDMAIAGIITKMVTLKT